MEGRLHELFKLCEHFTIVVTIAAKSDVIGPGYSVDVHEGHCVGVVYTHSGLMWITRAVNVIYHPTQTRVSIWMYTNQ